MTDPARSRLQRHAPLALVLLIGAALRLYPVHRPYVGADTQTAYPRAAVLAVTEGHWTPPWIAHGPGFFDLLRGTYTIWYGLGRVAGIYRDRLDLLVSFVARPLPFVAGARLVVVACALLSLLLVHRLGVELGTSTGGVAGAALLAVTFSHVRESHQVWPDVPAGMLTLAAVVASVATLRHANVRRAMAAGALGGLAIATKMSTFPVALPVAVAALASRGPLGARLIRASLAALAAVVAYLAASPHMLLDLRSTLAFTSHQYDLTFGASTHGALGLGQIILLGLGAPLALLGGIGLIVAARRRPAADWIVTAAFPIAYGIVLMTSTRLFVRYVAVLAPFVALFAGYAVAEAAGAVRSRGVVAALLALGLTAEPAWLALEYDRFLARDDTRSQAGAWLAAHAAPTAAITVPDGSGYVNPILPANDSELRRLYPAEAAELRRHLGSDLRGWGVFYRGPSGRIDRPWADERFVVTSSHPALFGHLSTPLFVLAAIRDAGGRVDARFAGTPDVLPDEVQYDPIDADYVPLRGWRALERPGPNLTIWRLPPSPR